MPRPRLLLLVPCDTHGGNPCPSPGGCKNRRLRAGLLPRASGTPGNKRRRIDNPLPTMVEVEQKEPT